MKKVYLSPTITLHNIDFDEVLLAGSDPDPIHNATQGAGNNNNGSDEDSEFNDLDLGYDEGDDIISI